MVSKIHNDVDQIFNQGRALMYQGKFEEAHIAYLQIRDVMHRMQSFHWTWSNVMNELHAILHNLCACTIKWNRHVKATCDLLRHADARNFGNVAVSDMFYFLMGQCFRLSEDFDMAEKMLNNAKGATCNAELLVKIMQEQQEVLKHKQYYTLLENLLNDITPSASDLHAMTVCNLECKPRWHQSFLRKALEKSRTNAALVIIKRGGGTLDRDMLRLFRYEPEMAKKLAEHILPVMNELDYSESWVVDVSIAANKIASPIIVSKCKSPEKMIQLLSMKDASGLPQDAIEEVMHRHWNMMYSCMILKLCIGLGGNPNAVSKGVPLLHQLVQQSNVEAVGLLLGANVAPNCKDANGDTALHVCANLLGNELSDQFKIWHLLVSHGISLSMKNMDGCTPLHLVCQRLHLDTLMSLTANFTLPELEITNSHAKTAYDLISIHRNMKSQVDIKNLLVSLISSVANHMRGTFERLLCTMLSTWQPRQVNGLPQDLLHKIGLFEKAVSVDNFELVKWMIRARPNIVKEPCNLDPALYPVHIAAKHRSYKCFSVLYYDSDYIRKTIANCILEGEATQLFAFIYDKECLFTQVMLESYLNGQSSINEHLVTLIQKTKLPVCFNEYTVEHIARIFSENLKLSSRIFGNISMEIWNYALKKGWINMSDCQHPAAIVGLFDMGARFENASSLYCVIKNNPDCIAALLATGHDLARFQKYICTIEHALVYLRYLPNADWRVFGFSEEGLDYFSDNGKPKHSNIQFCHLRSITRYADIVIHTMDGEIKPYERIARIPSIQPYVAPSTVTMPKFSFYQYDSDDYSDFGDYSDHSYPDFHDSDDDYD